MRKFLLLIMLLPLISIGQSLEKDTIHLKEVVINESQKPKLKTIKLGSGKGSASLSLLQNPEVVFLIEEIPRGDLKELTLYFGMHRKVWNDNGGKIIVNKSEFELVLYDVGDDGKIGEKLIDEPILITLESSNKTYIKKTLDLSKYNINTNRFFVYIKRISMVPCDECFLYLPATVFFEKKQWFYGDISTIKVNEGLQEKDSSTIHYQLRGEVKVMTRDY